jgi:hypothetical protein
LSGFRSRCSSTFAASASSCKYLQRWGSERERERACGEWLGNYVPFKKKLK